MFWYISCQNMAVLFNLQRSDRHRVSYSIYQPGGRPSPCEAVPEGGVWGLRSGFGGVFYGCPPPDTSQQIGTVQATNASTAHSRAKILQVDIPVDRYGHQMPGGRLSREGNKPHQPPVSFHSLAHIGHHCVTQQGTLPPLPTREV